MSIDIKFDKEGFENAKSIVLSLENGIPEQKAITLSKNAKRISRSHSLDGKTNIGGLGEGILHLTLKYFIEPDNSFHEIKHSGFYVDILKDDMAFEIQTRNFSSFKKKISCLIDDMPVCVIFPVIKEKKLIWTNPETGELCGFRKSPKNENLFNIFNELVYIKPLLKNEKLSFCIVELSCDEYKLLCGWGNGGKKGSVRINRIPKELFGIYNFPTCASLVTLLPNFDDDTITSEALSKKVKISRDLSRKVLNILCDIGCIECFKIEKNVKYYKKISGQH